MVAQAAPADRGWAAGRAGDRLAAQPAAGGRRGLIAPSVTRRLTAEFARIRAAAAPPKELDRPTERERAVLELVARGRSNAEIAEELVVGATTVKTHV